MLLNNEYPSDYTIIDLETTGLSPYKNSIIELSAIKVLLLQPASITLKSVPNILDKREVQRISTE